MRPTFRSIFFCLFVVSSTFAAGQAPVREPADTSINVTVIDHRARATSPAILSKDDIIVRQEGKVRPVLEWKRVAAGGASADVVVLIDDSLEASVSLQWKDVANFLRELPTNARVAVAYGTSSDATIAHPFSAGREAAIQALRIPLGHINEGSSIYLSLVSLLNQWPNDGRQRIVLLVSDGIDLFYGIRDSEPGLNGNLQRAIDAAQKKGVAVDSIFASGESHFSHNLFLINNGQSCLARLALETGGSAYTSGLETPVSFRPFLSQINQSLANMYELTFRASLPEKAGFARIQLAAEPAGVELLGPSRVYLPGAH